MDSQTRRGHRVVLVAARCPWPPRRGDQMRADQFARGLAELGHEVELWVPGAGAVVAAGDNEPRGVRVRSYRRSWTDRLLGLARAAVGGRPLQAGWFHSADLVRRLGAAAMDADLVLVQMARAALLLPALAGRPWAVDLIDCLSASFLRRASVDSRWRRPLLRWESGRLARWERRMVRGGLGACVVGARDRDEILAAAGEGDAGLESRLAVVPLAVPAAAGRRPIAGGEGAAPARVVLTGNLGYFVNRDALLWFLQTVWPALHRTRPGIELVVAGARAEAVRGPCRDAGVQLIESPADLRETLAAATVALAPMRVGAGVPVKVLEAWAVGTPVVASPWAAAGAGAVHDRELLVAETPAQWVGSILGLLDDPARRASLAAGGSSRLESEHSWGRFLKELERWLRGLEVGVSKAAASVGRD